MRKPTRREVKLEKMVQEQIVEIARLRAVINKYGPLIDVVASVADLVWDEISDRVDTAIAENRCDCPGHDE